MKLLVLASLFLPGVAFAFHTPSSFQDSVAQGGGHRMFFTGSARHKGYDCTACHTDAPKQITASVELTPAAGGAYVAGQLYTIAVSLAGDHRGFGARNNQNGFVAELVDDLGQPGGTLGGDVELLDDGNVIAGEKADTTMWTFTWRAPAAGRGAFTLHLGMVDGNGADTSSTPLTDPGGDDVAVVKLRLCEGAAGCAAPPAPAETESRVAGCDGSGAASPWLALLLLPLLFRRRRALMLVALGALAACFDPSVKDECPGRVCGTSGGDAGVSCRESWSCTSWEAPAGSDLATRTCTDRNNAGTTECKPATSATLPALDLELYKCQVHPIFQRGCGMMACHGNEDEHQFRVYTRGRWRNREQVTRVTSCLETGVVDLQQAASGTVMCEGWLPHTTSEWKKSFDSSRSFMLDVTSADDSLLLREVVVGGLPHAGVKLWKTRTDPDYVTIKSWLTGAKLGTTCNTGKN